MKQVASVHQQKAKDHKRKAFIWTLRKTGICQNFALTSVGKPYAWPTAQCVTAACFNQGKPCLPLHAHGTVECQAETEQPCMAPASTVPNATEWLAAGPAVLLLRWVCKLKNTNGRNHQSGKAVPPDQMQGHTVTTRRKFKQKGVRQPSLQGPGPSAAQA